MNNTIKFVKKGVSIAVTSTTILWSVGIGALAPLATHAAQPGQLVKKADSNTVYYVGSDNKRHIFIDQNTYFSWYSDFSGVVTVSESEFQSHELGGNITIRPGTKLVKITQDPKTYAIEPGGVLRWIQTPDIALTLYGDNVWNRVVDVMEVYFSGNYTIGTPISTNTYPTGTLIKSATGTDIYYVDGTTKRLATSAGLTANYFNVSNVVTAPDSVFNALTAGSGIAALDTNIWNPASGAGATPPSTGTGLTVALASDSPSAVLLPTGSAYNTVLKLNLTASADGAVNVTGLKVKRSGFSLDTDIAGLAIFDSSNVRHGNFVTISDNIASAAFSSNPVVVPAGQTVPAYVKTNISSTGSTSGTMQFSVEAAASVTTIAVVNGAFPVMSGIHSLTNGGTSLGALDVDAATISASAVTVDIGTIAQPIGKFKLTETSSRENVKIKSIKLFNNGNASDSDISNIALKDITSGTIVATTSTTANRYATFALDYTLTKGTNRTWQVQADVVNGSTRTAQFIVQNDYDIEVQGVSTGAGILPVHAVGVDATTGFPVGETANYNTISINAGSLTAAKDSSSRSGNIGQGETGVKFATVKLDALGEDIELQKILVDVGTSSTATCTTVALCDLTGTVNVKVNDTTIYSVTASSATIWASTSQQTLSTNYIIKGGTSALLTVVGDVHTSNATNGQTFRVGVSDIYYKKVVSNSYATASAATLINGNTLTVTTASLTVSKNTGFANQTQVAGESGLKIGSFVLQAGSAEGVNVTSINVDLSSNTGLTNLKIKNGSTQLGSTIGSPSTTSGANSFSFSLQIPISGTATIDAYVDTSTSATSVTTTIPASGVSGNGMISGTTISSITGLPATGQTITVTGGGTLIIATTANSPIQAVLHANETDVPLLNFSLSSTGENVNVTKLVFESVNGSTNYQNIKLVKASDNSQVGTAVSLVDGKATFAGINLVSPKDSSLYLFLKGSVNESGTITSASSTAFAVTSVEATGAASGSQIYPYTHTTVGTAGIPLVGGVAVTVTSSLGFNVGDGVLAYNTTDGVEWGMITAVGSSTAVTVGTEADMTAIATRITRLPTVVTTAASAGILLAAGTVAATVSSTKGFAVGDIVLAYNATDGVELGVVVSIDSATAMKIGTKADTTTAAARVTKLSGGATTAASAGILLVGGVAATVTSTTGFAVGDAVFAFNATDGVELGIVTAVGSSTSLTVATEANTTTAVSRITKLATFNTTTASAGIPLVGGVAVTVASNVGHATGDPVIAFNVTDGVEIGIVTATSGSTSTTIGVKTNMTVAASRVSRLWSVTASSNAFTIHDVEPVITMNASSLKCSNTCTGASNQAVAKFDVTASGYRTLTIKSLTLTRGGNIGGNVAVGSQPKVYINGDLKGTGANWSGTTSGSTSLITLTSPYDINAGTIATLEIQVDTSSAIATNTFQVYIDGVAGTFGNVNWYYNVSSSSPGFTTAPTNSSPATIADTYPVYGNSLSY